MPTGSCPHSGGASLGHQYDNLTSELTVQGDLPEGWEWDILVSAGGNGDTWHLTPGDGQASIALTEDNLSVEGEYYLQLRGIKGELVRHTNIVTAHNFRSLSGAGQWPTLPTEWIQAEAAIKELNAHPPVPGENGYWMLWDLDTHSYVQSQLVVPGLHIEIGETTTGEPGTPASVTNSGTNTAPVLNFTIPEGEKGDAATIQVGEVTASDPGSEPQVKNSGTENAAVFDFVLPRGNTGPTGPAATIEVESTVTGEPGTQASVENVGTTGAAKLRFTIPRGNTGQNGVTPTLSAGNVETLEPGQPATASVTGEGPAYQINLGIPRGQTGAQGAPGQNGEDGQTPTISVGTVTTLDPGQDATAEITGETPNLTLNLGIPQGRPGKDGVQLNDSAVNTTEAWSSKKIVDTLCPSFSVTGNPVTCHPVEGYPLSAVVTLEPKQAGSGDPSPENVRPISGYDEVAVNVRGKNLLDYSGEIIIPQDIYQYTYRGEEFITALNKIPRNTPLVMSANWSYVSETRVGKRITVVYGDYTYTSFDEGVSRTIEDREIMESWLYSGDDKTQDCIVSSIQFEAGSTPTPYEPYQPGTTATITFPETIYGGTVDAVTGVGSKEWAVVTLNSEFLTTNEWAYDTAGNQATPVLYGRIPLAFTNVGDIYCTHFKHAISVPINNLEYWSKNAYFGNTRIAIRNDVWTDLESAITWLDAQESAGTPVQVAYKLATPEPFQATGNQALPAVAGENTVYTDGNSLAVSGRSDPLSTIQTMQAQITTLQDQATQGGTA